MLCCDVLLCSTLYCVVMSGFKLCCIVSCGGRLFRMGCAVSFCVVLSCVVLSCDVMCCYVPCCITVCYMHGFKLCCIVSCCGRSITLDGLCCFVAQFHVMLRFVFSYWVGLLSYCRESKFSLNITFRFIGTFFDINS